VSGSYHFSKFELIQVFIRYSKRDDVSRVSEKHVLKKECINMELPLANPHKEVKPSGRIHNAFQVHFR